MGEEFTDPALRNILERPCEMRGERWDHQQTGQLQIVHLEFYAVNKVLKLKSKSKWLGQWSTLADTLVWDFQKQWKRSSHVVEDCEVFPMIELGLATLRSGALSAPPSSLIITAEKPGVACSCLHWILVTLFYPTNFSFVDCQAARPQDAGARQTLSRGRRPSLSILPCRNDLPVIP